VSYQLLFFSLLSLHLVFNSLKLTLTRSSERFSANTPPAAIKQLIIQRLFPNPDKPEPKLKDKTEKDIKNISSATQKLTKVRNKILLIY
jgi:hypothetical protein